MSARHGRHRDGDRCNLESFRQEVANPRVHVERSGLKDGECNFLAQRKLPLIIIYEYKNDK